MCNHGSIDRSRMMRFSVVVRRFAGCAAIFACAGFPLAAQIPPIRAGAGFYVDEFEAMSNQAQFDSVGTQGLDSAFALRRTPPPQEQTFVSVDELRHPLTGKARHMLAKALGYAERGDHTRAISTLHEGVAKDGTLAPYSHGLLGIEYLRSGRSAEAIPELTEAVKLFPHDARVRTNYAISLCMAGQFDNAERETQRALSLDPTLHSAQELMRLIDAAKIQPSRSASQRSTGLPLTPANR